MTETLKFRYKNTTEPGASYRSVDPGLATEVHKSCWDCEWNRRNLCNRPIYSRFTSKVTATYYGSSGNAPLPCEKLDGIEVTRS